MYIKDSPSVDRLFYFGGPGIAEPTHDVTLTGFSISKYEDVSYTHLTLLTIYYV